MNDPLNKLLQHEMPGGVDNASRRRKRVAELDDDAVWTEFYAPASSLPMLASASPLPLTEPETRARKKAKHDGLKLGDVAMLQAGGASASSLRHQAVDHTHCAERVSMQEAQIVELQQQVAALEVGSQVKDDEIKQLRSQLVQSAEQSERVATLEQQLAQAQQQLDDMRAQAADDQQIALQRGAIRHVGTVSKNLGVQFHVRKAMQGGDTVCVWPTRGTNATELADRVNARLQRRGIAGRVRVIRADEIPSQVLADPCLAVDVNDGTGREKPLRVSFSTRGGGLHVYHRSDNPMSVRSLGTARVGALTEVCVVAPAADDDGDLLM